MTEEVQWGEWEEGWRGRYVFRRSSNDDIEAASAAYLNALEREVRELREYKALAGKLHRSLETIVNGLRDGWWGEGSGELEEGEL